MKFDLICLGDHLPDPHTGTHNETQEERHRMWVDLGVHAEDAGYDGYWLGEHHFSDYILSAPQMLLAAIATRTRRIRLGTGVSLLPTNDPVRLAEDFATLDLLSGGRAEIGLGGGLTEHTFAAFGLDPGDAAALAEEKLDLLQRLWTEEEVDWSGRFRPPLVETRLQPRTASGRAIPISRATANSMETARTAGEAGHKLLLMTVFGRFSGYREIAGVYRDAYRAAGHDPAGLSVAAIAYVHADRDGQKARDRWYPYRDRYRAFTRWITENKGLSKGLKEFYAKLGPGTDQPRESDFCGAPEEITAQILQADADMDGIDRLLCYVDLGGMARADIFASVDLFAEAVIPAVRDALNDARTAAAQ